MEAPQTTTGVQKLLAGPLKTFIDSGGKRFACWIHKLCEKEQLMVDAVAMENLRLAVKDGLDDEACWYRRNRAEICQRLFYSLRAGIKEGDPENGGAPRVFDERMVAMLPIEEVNRLAKEYKEAFVLTEEERKNFLRERLGEGSEISSISPKGTGSKRSSRKGR